MPSTKPQEPDWNQVIDEVLKEMEEDGDYVRADEPVGIQWYHLSQHSKNIRSLEAFDWPDEWIRERPILLAWLEHEFEHWWADQAYDDEGWRGWLEGYEIRVHDDAYLGELVLKLTNLYRERITETYECETCGKILSEKHPYGHPNAVVRLGIAIDNTVPRDEIEYIRHIFCNACWRKRTERE
jgi:hypothetical protein